MNQNGSLNSIDSQDNEDDSTYPLSSKVSKSVNHSDAIASNQDTLDAKAMIIRVNETSLVQTPSVASTTPDNSSCSQIDNNTMDTSSRLLNLPAEILIMIMEHLLPIPTHSWTDRVDYLYTDHVGWHDRLLKDTHTLTATSRTCHTLKEFQRQISFRDATIRFIHDDISSTLKFLSGLSISERNLISGLRLDYRRTKPVDYKAFRELCHILNTMSSLQSLYLSIPVNTPHPYQKEIGLGPVFTSYNEYIMYYVKYRWSVVKGLGWRSDKRAPWVQDILTVKPGTLKDFELTTTPRKSTFGLRHWLRNIMLQDGAARRAAVEKSDRRLTTGGDFLLWQDPLFIILILLVATLAWVLFN